MNNSAISSIIPILNFLLYTLSSSPPLSSMAPLLSPKPLLLVLHQPFSPPSFFPPIRAMRSMPGKVVCATSDKTVAVEVVRLAPHPKYKRHIRKKKKYQAHDPENRFKVGDIVQLEKSRPISKTKTFCCFCEAYNNRRLRHVYKI